MTMLVAPVTKTIVVSCLPERAFALWTEQIGSWWPLRTHSVFHDDAVELVFEPKLGGQVYEVSSTGERNVWSTVLAWDPPSRIVLTWSPDRDQSVQTELELRFTAEGLGTRVQLIHRGWERWGEQAQSYRDGYDSGWAGVLERFETATT